jgi:hypothetical protein
VLRVILGGRLVVVEPLGWVLFAEFHQVVVPIVS